MTDNQRLAEVLENEARYPSWVSHKRLYRLRMIVHSRVSSLRARGWNIECRRDGSEYLYTVRSAPGEKKQ